MSGHTPDPMIREAMEVSSSRLASTPERAQPPRLFIWVAGVCLALFIAAHTWQAISDRGPEARARELMPVVGAQLVDRPLTAGEASHALQVGSATMRLGDLPPDRLIFLNFWATWCKPCVEELPSMIALGRELAGKGLLMVAVSYDDAWSDIDGFFERIMGGVPRELRLARDPVTDEPDMLRTSFGTHKLPETYVLRGGRVLARFVNARRWTDPTIVEYFERLLEVR